jgi:hypothetical protein
MAEGPLVKPTAPKGGIGSRKHHQDHCRQPSRRLELRVRMLKGGERPPEAGCQKNATATQTAIKADLGNPIAREPESRPVGELSQQRVFGLHSLGRKRWIARKLILGGTRRGGKPNIPTQGARQGQTCMSNRA